MARVKRGVTAKKRHKKVIKLAKGFRGRAKSCYRIALTRVERSLQYAYRDRRNKKRDLRGIWIQRINAAAREHGLKYSILISLLKKANITLDRKQLSEMAATSPESFKTLVNTVKV
ncbi:MAG: 50S ribosomal protein L20 [Rickettsiales bacterium]|jgi:large subunit ribosomal protein L20|nr:50S ribosomal protein L20 [Rickettsiales bacterium]